MFQPLFKITLICLHILEAIDSNFKIQQEVKIFFIDSFRDGIFVLFESEEIDLSMSFSIKLSIQLYCGFAEVVPAINSLSCLFFDLLNQSERQMLNSINFFFILS